MAPGRRRAAASNGRMLFTWAGGPTPNRIGSPDWLPNSLDPEDIGKFEWRTILAYMAQARTRLRTCTGGWDDRRDEGQGTESRPGAGAAGPGVIASHAASGKLEDRRGPVFPSGAKGERDGAGLGEQPMVGRG